MLSHIFLQVNETGNDLAPRVPAPYKANGVSAP